MKTVFISDNREITAVEIYKHLLSRGYNAILNGKDVNIDISDYNAVSRYFKSLGRLDVVIYPAPPVRHAAIEDADEELWKDGFKDGALSAFNITKAAGEIMTVQKSGAIIYLGSIHADKPIGKGFIYSLSCSATQMLCREAALDLGAYGVNCFYIQRGIMEHDMVNKNEFSNQYSAPDKRYPLKKLQTPDTLNGLCEFLMTEAASPLNGSDLKADGGFTMYYGNKVSEGAWS